MWHPRLALWLFILSASPFAGVAAAGPMQLDQLHDAVRRSEDRLNNLIVKGEAISDSWDRQSGQWQNDGESDVTAFFIGKPGSKVRIDFDRDLSRWVDGAAPYSLEKYTVAYNGRIGQRLTLQTGSPKNQIHTLRGEIGTNRPPEASGFGGLASGWTISLYGAMDAAGQRFSDLLEKKHQGDVVIGTADFNNSHCVEVTLKHPRHGAKAIWYLDPDRGYAVVGLTRFFANGKTFEQWKVEKMAEPAPGVFYPTAASGQAWGLDGKPMCRATYKASSVLVNSPKVTDDLFTISWPAGTFVDDKRSGHSFTVSQGAAQPGEQMRQQVRDIKKSLATRPSVQSMPGGN